MFISGGLRLRFVLSNVHCSGLSTVLCFLLSRDKVEGNDVAEGRSYIDKGRRTDLYFHLLMPARTPLLLSILAEVCNRFLGSLVSESGGALSEL